MRTARRERVTIKEASGHETNTAKGDRDSSKIYSKIIYILACYMQNNSKFRLQFVGDRVHTAS